MASREGLSIHKSAVISFFSTGVGSIMASSGSSSEEEQPVLNPLRIRIKQKNQLTNLFMA